MLQYSALALALEETGPRVNEADVSALEQDLSARLPLDYRSFLLTTNGGLLPANQIHVMGAPWTPTNVYALFGLSRHLDTSDLRWNREIYSLQSLDPSLLPIACDAGGCPFCLVLNCNSGAIVYIDLENVERHYFVAERFSVFMKRIVPFVSPSASSISDRTTNMPFLPPLAAGVA